MCGNDMLPKNFSRRICDKQLPTAFPHRLGTLGCGADFSKKALLHRGHTNCPICHNLTMCGCYRPSRRTQIVEEYFDRVSGRTKLEFALQHCAYSICRPNPPQTQDSPVNCRKFAGD